MAYQPLYPATSTAAKSPGTGYQSLYGAPVRQAPSASDLAASRANEQPTPTPAPQKSTSLMSKIVSGAKNVGKGLVEDAKSKGERALNTVTAGGAGIIGLGTAGVQAATGNKKGANTTLAATQQTMNDFLNKGVGGKGAYLTSKQAASQGTGVKGIVNDVAKPVAQGATDLAPYVIPVGKAAEGASLLAKMGRGALENAVVSGGTSAANDALNGRLKKEGGAEFAKNTALGATLGALIPALHAGVKGAAREVTPPAELIRNQKTQTLLDAAKKQETPPPEIKPAVDQGKVNAGLIKPEVTNVPRSELAISANDVHKPDAQKVGQYVKQIKDGEPIEPVITHTVDGQKFVVDGQQKLAAADKLGIDHVPTVEKVSSTPVNTSPAEAPIVEKTISSAPVEKAAVEPSATVPDRGTSKVASSVQEKAVARGLKNDFGEAGGYDKVTIADQSAKAVKVANDRPLLDKIISGEKSLPNGLRATALIKAVEEHPELSKDVPLLNRLSQAEHLTGESSRSAQELRLAAERSPHNPVEAIRGIRKAREAAIERKTGKSVAKAQDHELKAIRAARATIPKPTKETFASFVESLKC